VVVRPLDDRVAWPVREGDPWIKPRSSSTSATTNRPRVSQRSVEEVRPPRATVPKGRHLTRKM
jgi:hypothetical protein